MVERFVATDFFRLTPSQVSGFNRLLSLAELMGPDRIKLADREQPLLDWYVSIEGRVAKAKRQMEAEGAIRRIAILDEGKVIAAIEAKLHPVDDYHKVREVSVSLASILKPTGAFLRFSGRTPAQELFFRAMAWAKNNGAKRLYLEPEDASPHARKALDRAIKFGIISRNKEILSVPRPLNLKAIQKERAGKQFPIKAKRTRLLIPRRKKPKKFFRNPIRK